MLHDLSVTWPFSIHGGVEFAVVFLVISGISLGLGVLMAILIGDLWDGAVRHADESNMVSGGFTSVGVGTAADSFLVGRLPRGEELLVIAYLKGLRHLEAVLFAMGSTAGWLRPGLARHDAGANIVLADVVVDDPLLARAKDAIENQANGATWQIRVRQAASRLRPALQRRAETMGVARAGERRTALVALALLGGALSVMIAFVRVATAKSGGEFLAFYYIIPIELIVTVLLAIAFTHQHRQARSYLRWLDGVVDALRDDVKADRATDRDVVLIAALDGMDGLGATGDRLKQRGAR